MGAKSLIQTGRLYDQDFVAWASETARLLRAGRFEDVDVEHLAEEVEDMANRDKRELRSRLTVLLLHLLKWEHQPSQRSGGWESTMRGQRDEMEDLLEQSPSLKRLLPGSLPRSYRRAAERAALETSQSSLPRGTFPGECPFSIAQILDPTFYPGR